MHSHTDHQGKTRQLRNHTSPLFSAMVARSQSSAAGVLALLYEPESVFKQYALKALNPLVPQFWAEISEHIALMSVQFSFVAFCMESDRSPDAEKPSMRAMNFPRMFETQLLL
jgi:hypothetical protein